MPRPLLAFLLLSAAPAWAEVPTVLADTAPVHSLVAQVMGDLGEPALIVPPGTSPHDASLTPSEAQALTEADLVVWTGDAFLPWLGETIVALAPEATVLPLLDSDGWEPLPLAEEEGHDHDHGEGAIDPHAWLDPAVAAAWLPTIAEALAAEDPENAGTYRANAAAAADRLVALGAELEARLAPLAGAGYATGHDAYRYLGRAAGLPPGRAIASADGAEPAPSDIAALRDEALSGEVACLLLDAETDPAWADTLGEGTELRTAMVDPDGVTLEPGPELYSTLMLGLAEALESCLSK